MRLGIRRWLVLKKTFSDSAVVEGRLAMAVKLFEMGKLTSGQASQLAGMGRVEFLYELKRFNVSAIQVEGDELQQDLANAAKAAGRD